ncbi:MAG: hypothetical protein U0Q16_36400 [Bryobacteraceae bacterium]
MPPKQDPNVLVLCSDGATWKQIQRLLFDERHPVLRAETYHEAVEACQSGSTAVIVSEARIGGHTWRDILTLARGMQRPAYLVVVSREANEELWLDVLDAGGVNVFSTTTLGDDLRRSVVDSLTDWIHLR